jgi:hypothetical protein
MHAISVRGIGQRSRQALRHQEKNEFWSRCLVNGAFIHSTMEVKKAVAIGGDKLVVAAAEAEELRSSS